MGPTGATGRPRRTGLRCPTARATARQRTTAVPARRTRRVPPTLQARPSGRLMRRQPSKDVFLKIVPETLLQLELVNDYVMQINPRSMVIAELCGGLCHFFSGAVSAAAA